MPKSKMKNDKSVLSVPSGKGSQNEHNLVNENDDNLLDDLLETKVTKNPS